MLLHGPEARDIEGVVLHQGPQDAQELVHQDTQGLHLGEGVLSPSLQVLVLPRKCLIHSHQAHHSEEQGRMQAWVTLNGT